MGDQTRIGVDIGGTFTDLVTVSDGKISTHKTPSTPTEPENAVLTGITAVTSEYNIPPQNIGFLGHGTTVATNAVLEQSWAETALITTDGFRDVIEIGRQNRPDLYDFQASKPDPVIPRDKRYEVPERMDARGNVLIDLDEEKAESIAEIIHDNDISSVAVSLLFSFENPKHERLVREILTEATDASVSISSDVLPEIREFERTLATCLNAGLKPVMDNYIGRLEELTASLEIPVPLRIMQSNGGVITATAARTRPINTLLSGPAAGVQGARFVGNQVGHDDVVTMDMGGTSCDVSVVQDGEPLLSTNVTMGDYPISVPMIDIHTIGAGGGSVAWIDAGNALRVGPRSAGADPGPVCYGRGGSHPTVTDAHYCLGRIDPSSFGHQFSVPEKEVDDVMNSEIASKLSRNNLEAAQGILDVANANMERALRVVTVERGLDPRSYGLVAFGGAGPLHACKLASDLDIPSVIVPRMAGVLSALGLIISDIVYDYSTSRIRSWDSVDATELLEQFQSFEATGSEELSQEGVAESNQSFEWAIDMRYSGQSFDLTIPIENRTLDSSSLSELVERFHERHKQRYGHASPDEPLELVTVRLRARGKVPTPPISKVSTTGVIDDAIKEERVVRFDGRDVDTQVFARKKLPGGSEFAGPGIIEGDESTIVVHPGQHVEVDSYGNVIVSTTS